MSGVMFAVVPAGASVAARLRVPLHAAAVKDVSYAGYRITVPASWPVYRLDRDPATCVRYDVSAVYLGTPGASQQCPAHLAGRTQTVSITRAGVVFQRAGGGSMPGLTGGARAGRLASVGAELMQDAQQQVLGASLAGGSVITATYGGDPGVIRRVLASLHLVRAAQRHGSAVRRAVVHRALVHGVTAPRVAPHRVASRLLAPHRVVSHRVAFPRVALRRMLAHSVAARTRVRRKSVPDLPVSRPRVKASGAVPAATKNAARRSAPGGNPAGPATGVTGATAPGDPAGPGDSVAPGGGPGSSAGVPGDPGTASPGVSQPGASQPATPQPAGPQPGSSAPGMSQPGQPPSAAAPQAGFDTCTAPSLAAMRAWRSRYAVAGIYIGGVNMACDFGNLTPAWIQAAERMHWSLIPTYVGPQAPCYGAGTMINPAQAKAQGFAAAADAVRDAASFGLGKGTPIYYDMEAYKGPRSCSAAVVAFVAGWTRGLNAQGYVSGVYSSASSGIVDLQAAAAAGWAAPQAIWIARWDGQSSLTDGALQHVTPWLATKRNKQFRGDHWQTVGGVKLEIDSDTVGGPVAGPTPAASQAPPTPPASQYPSPPAGAWPPPDELGPASPPSDVEPPSDESGSPSDQWAPAGSLPVDGWPAESDDAGDLSAQAFPAGTRAPSALAATSAWSVQQALVTPPDLMAAIRLKCE